MQNGWSLLLIADHAPFGGAAEVLSERLSVEMSKGNTTDIDNHDDQMRGAGSLVFSRENRLLNDHPVTRGRNVSERVGRVISFDGQSLKGPNGSAAILSLSDSAIDFSPDPPFGPTPRTQTPAGGRAQAIALSIGEGRVVVLGEAAMLTAQVARVPFQDRMRIGISREDIDNQQFALNIMHWLSGLL